MRLRTRIEDGISKVTYHGNEATELTVLNVRQEWVIIRVRDESGDEVEIFLDLPEAKILQGLLNNEVQ